MSHWKYPCSSDASLVRLPKANEAFPSRAEAKKELLGDDEARSIAHLIEQRAGYDGQREEESELDGADPRDVAGRVRREDVELVAVEGFNQRQWWGSRNSEWLLRSTHYDW